jgi:hypothetical protein
MRRLVGLAVFALAGVGAWSSAAPAAPAAGPAGTAGPAGGAEIAYVTGTARSQPSVWVAGASGGDARRLADGDEPLLAPDGDTVAASDLGSTGSALSLYPAGGVGSAASYFSIADVSANALAWSPDSRYLAVSLAGDNAPSISGYGLAIIDTETGTEKTIATGVIYGASFAPGASDMLVYARASSLSASAGTNIYTVAADGTGTEQITTNGRSADPVWGVRGIAFDQARPRREGPLDQIWLMQPHGTGRRQITRIAVGPLESGLAPLAFSADGTRLAAEFEGEDTGIGYSVSLLTGRATQLKVGNEAVSAWGISRDGRSILISVGGFEQPANRGKIEAIPFSGGHPTLLVAHGDFPSWDR